MSMIINFKSIINYLMGFVTGEDLIANEVLALRGCRFASFLYHSKTSGEIARHSVMLGVDYAKARRRDVVVLKARLPRLTGVDRIACKELIASLDREGVSPLYTQSGYLHDLGKGLKLGAETGAIYVHGFSRGKTIIEEGIHKTVKSSPKTLAKNRLRKLMKTSRVRQYLLSNIHEARINGKHLELI
jgi:hypothetical protein